MQEAGIADGSGFSTETASYSRTGNSHCRDDNRKWFAWKKACGALHKCDFWDDEASLLRDIQEAVDTKATVLILERLG